MLERRVFARRMIAPLLWALLLATPLGAAENDCSRLDIEVTCSVRPSRIVLSGDRFEVTATARNTGDHALAKVTLAMAGGDGVVYQGGDELVLVIPKLAPGESRQISCRFISDGIGERKIRASASDEGRWTASGCICGVLVKGLPALQMEMVDMDMNRERKGIFAQGEEFIYSTVVENDMGTALTPDLQVVWVLPPELEFVSGVGDRGAAVTGEGQRVESSSFQVSPDQTQKFEIVVRVLAVPKKYLVQTKVAVVSVDGTIELAQKTESTTLKGASTIPAGTTKPKAAEGEASESESAPSSEGARAP